jgi:hypothetical protein
MMAAKRLLWSDSGNLSEFFPSTTPFGFAEAVGGSSGWNELESESETEIGDGDGDGDGGHAFAIGSLMAEPLAEPLAEPFAHFDFAPFLPLSDRSARYAACLRRSLSMRGFFPSGNLAITSSETTHPAILSTSSFFAGSAPLPHWKQSSRMYAPTSSAVKQTVPPMKSSA